MITETAPAAKSTPLLCMWCHGGGKDVLGVACKRCDGTGDEPAWAMKIWNGEATKPKPPTYGGTPCGEPDVEAP
jgi:hypothetical protein